MPRNFGWRGEYLLTAMLSCEGTLDVLFSTKISIFEMNNRWGSLPSLMPQLAPLVIGMELVFPGVHAPFRTTLMLPVLPGCRSDFAFLMIVISAPWPCAGFKKYVKGYEEVDEY